MKSLITKKLSDLRNKKQKAFVPFVTAGDPDLKTTKDLIFTFEKSGASIIELGVPFSDPMADGPVIQRATERALENHVHLPDILKLVKNVRKTSEIPILLMGYYNPVLQFGLKRFANEAARSGVNAVLIVDLPVEEAKELQSHLKPKGIDLIFLVTPTSTEKRLKLVQKYGSGFVYYVSLSGVTGAGHINPKKIKSHINKVKKIISRPLLIGFGISKPAHVKTLAPLADGVIVGSALIKSMEAQKSKPQKVKAVKVLSEKLIRAL